MFNRFRSLVRAHAVSIALVIGGAAIPGIGYVGYQSYKYAVALNLAAARADAMFNALTQAQSVGPDGKVTATTFDVLAQMARERVAADAAKKSGVGEK